MSDAKTEYRTTVWAQKKASFFDSELLKDIVGGMNRARDYRQNWQSVNLNDFVAKFTPNPTIKLDGIKLEFTSQDGKLAVICDIGGTYCRLAEVLGPNNYHYLGIDGKDAHNYTDERGKQHGRSRGEWLIVTHFRIQKWKEMTKYLPAKYFGNLLTGEIK